MYRRLYQLFYCNFFQNPEFPACKGQLLDNIVHPAGLVIRGPYTFTEQSVGPLRSERSISERTNLLYLGAISSCGFTWFADASRCQRAVVNANVINQAGEETAGFKGAAGANVQAAC